MLPRDCSASGMFAVHNVMSCPALVRKLVFCFYKRVKAYQNSIVQAITGVARTFVWGGGGGAPCRRDPACISRAHV